MKRVAISMGDAIGIGPEVVAKALADARVRKAIDPIVFGEASHLRKLGCDARVVETRGILGAVDAAARACIAREADALCTAPLSKERASREDPAFVGHTERLAQLAGARTAMMMAGPRLRVVLATNHLRLAEVPKRLTAEQIVFVGKLALAELKHRFAIEAPRIAVLGLNPHAGDGGLFGDEEERIIAPAIAQLQALGIDATGPWPADGLYPRALRGDFDCVIAQYHDQGLIPVKLLDFRGTVNVTLGLPFPRTSPDHGTADDIAGKGIADPEPMISALLLAAHLAR
jgi:4-hydroxythreonine-4-phosphate dehydrogenase